jgi:dihydropyrimidinase
VITGGTVVTEEGQREAAVGVRSGRVAQIGGQMNGKLEIDAAGALLLPGGVDPHVHLSMSDIDPGEASFADDFTSGSEAALAGGVTSLGNMSFVLPWESLHARVAAETELVARQAIADVFLHLAITCPTENSVREIRELVPTGQNSVKFFMTLPSFGGFAHQYALIMEATGKAGGIVLIHCEDLPTIECCTAILKKQDRAGVRHYAESRPVSSEIIATERALALCRATGAPTYIVHLSSARALEACSNARAEGLPVYVETRPLYLYLTADRYGDEDGALYVAQPPLREAQDVEAIWRGLASGAIDTMGSDHAPWTRALKMDPALTVSNARPGVAELETMLPMLFTEGVAAGRISLERFVALSATNAARLFGLYPRKGTIAVGSDADIVIWETRERRKIRGDVTLSRAGHSVYGGHELAAWPRMTIRRGEIVFQEGRITGSPGSGQVIPRGKSESLPRRG